MSVVRMPSAAPAAKVLPYGNCAHPRHEDVTTYGGDVIAVRCASCTHIVCHVAQCDGCGKNGRLYKFEDAQGKRFCDDGCFVKFKAAKAQARAAKRKAEDAAAKKAATR